MATNDEYLRLRRMTGEVGESQYTNTDLDLYITSAGSLESAAARIWAEKASGYADLVNISEAGSSRSNSDLFKHATDQRDHFLSLAPSGDPGSPTSTDSGSTTRRIVRA